MASESALFTSFHIGLPPWRCQRTLPLREVPTPNVEKVMKMKQDIQDCLHFCVPWRQAAHGVSLGPSCNLRKKLRRSTIKASMWAASKSFRKFSLEGPSGAFWIAVFANKSAKRKPMNRTTNKATQNPHWSNHVCLCRRTCNAHCTRCPRVFTGAFWSDGWMDGWTDGRTDGWMDGGGWLDGRTNSPWTEMLRWTGGPSLNRLEQKRNFVQTCSK